MTRLGVQGQVLGGPWWIPESGVKLLLGRVSGGWSRLGCGPQVRQARSEGCSLFSGMGEAGQVSPCWGGDGGAPCSVQYCKRVWALPPVARPIVQG